jgi:hypothetical protein
LLAIEPQSGRVAWRFCPYGRDGETIYSSPAVVADRLLVGDRRGYLHCLAAETGETLWRTLTSRADNNDVNSEPVTDGKVAVVGTNARLALGYDIATGRPVWRQRLDGPCTNCVPAGSGLALLWTGRSAYLVTIADGQFVWRWHRRNVEVESACHAAQRVLLVTRPVSGKDRVPGPVADLRGYRGEVEVFSRPYARWALVTLRLGATRGQVSEATAFGLGILDPKTGRRNLVVSGFGHDEAVYGRVSQPDFSGGLLYALGERGHVFALRLP